MLNVIHFLVLVLLCFHLHACNARNHGVMVHPAKESHQQKNEQKLNPVSVSMKAKPKGKYSDEKMEKISAINGGNNEHDFGVVMTGDRVQGLGSRKTSKSATSGSVSWRVPQKKRGSDQQETGFNLDYLPPRTHPPAHN